MRTSQEGKFDIHWLNGTTSKSLPHELISSVREYETQYDEEEDYWVEDDETVPYVSIRFALPYASGPG